MEQIVNRASTVLAGCVMMIRAVLAEVNVLTTGIILIPDPFAATCADTGLILQAVSTDYLAVKYLPLYTVIFFYTNFL